MGTTAEKLTYLNGTKRLLRRRINSLGGNITLETKFRDYLLWLDRFYDAASSPVNFEILGETKLKAVNVSTNELYIPDGEIVTDGITLTISNGKITINGTATRDVWIKITNGIEAVYTTPITWITGIEIDDPYGWAEEKVIEYDEPTKTYTQFCHGTGDSVTGASGLNGVNVLIKYSNNAYSSLYQNFESFRDRTYTDMHVEGTVTSNNVVEINCVYLYFNQGITVNQYFWLQQCLTQESTWTPNYDAAPPSPDNPKEIINKSGEITYTASDGTEFPVNLKISDENYYELADINGTKDKIYYENGKFYCLQSIGGDALTKYYRRPISYEDGKFTFLLIGEPSTITDAKIICSHYNGKLSSDNNSIYIENSKCVIVDNRFTSVSEFEDWLYPDNFIYIKYVKDYSTIREITEEDQPLYNQLKAIIDYETKLEIEEKIF